MKKGVYLLPNGLTLCGMFFGFYSILSSFNGNYVHASWSIYIAIVFDGLDGWAARLTHSTTRFGIELDSLSDLVAFGVAPAVMVFGWTLNSFGRLGWAASFLFVSSGALRLARYNIQMGSAEKKAFTGMPIPGAAAVLAAMVIFYDYMWGLKVHCIIGSEKDYFILILTIVLAVLMISTLRFHGAKELDLKERKPFWVLIIIMTILVIILMNPPIAFFIFAVSYVGIGLVENIWLFYRKHKKGNDNVKTDN
ncbi:MAG: CDP-diacylglycerol--serine O-phosphatidyltransferase [Nitrospirae bacterium]|nr:CDP-diacylglycerol--serine O-phosphatidyltransferase [Nitrospirota bacterium]